MEKFEVVFRFRKDVQLTDDFADEVFEAGFGDGILSQTADRVKLTCVREGKSFDEVILSALKDFKKLKVPFLNMRAKPHVDEAKIANLFYDIIVEECGASDRDRDDFVDYMTDDTGFPKEFRFQGHLGFGGKFYKTPNRCYVSCYPEDQTPERQIMIARANRKIIELFQNV